MNLELKYISLQNFKGLKGEHVINFGESLTLLFGPNGYGKTTIFDGIEFALTGRISRIDTDTNERQNKLHTTTVVHNRSNEAVIVKLCLDINSRNYTITRTLPANMPKYGVNRFWGAVKTTLQVQTEYPDEVGQEELEATLFGNSNSHYLREYFRLLTYIPQVDAIHFLKQPQTARHKQLSALLDMSQEESYLAELKDSRDYIAGLFKYVKTKTEAYETMARQEESPILSYVPLIDASPLHDFDKPNPFDGITADDAQSHFSNLSKELGVLDDFLKTFSVKEYAKFKLNEKIRTIATNEKYISSLIFQDLSNDEVNHVRNIAYLARIAAAPNFCERFILQNFLRWDKFNHAEGERARFNKYKSVLFGDGDDLRDTKTILTALANPSNDFLQETRERAAGLLNVYKLKEKSISESQGILKQTQEFRRLLQDHVKKINAINKHKSSECVLCGHDWRTNTLLVEAIAGKTESLEKLIGTETASLIEYEKSIKDEFLEEIVRKGRDFISSQSEQIKSHERIRSYGVIPGNELNIFDSFTKEFKGMDNFIISDQANLTVLNDNVTGLREFLDKHVPHYDSDILNKLYASIGYDNHTTQELIDTTDIKLPKIAINIKQLATYGLSDFNTDLLKVRIPIEDYLKGNRVDPAMINNPHLFKDYFSESAEAFASASKSIEGKISYLKQEYKKIVNNAYNQRKQQLQKIEKLHLQLQRFYRQYENAFRSYQKELTQPLKAPFYIYSAKILQNTPRGQGIFIKTDVGTDAVVFSTSVDTTHDALHQLSSGQLAVVSLAFHLAVNTVYNKESLHLLVIDDPIHDMDALNIHSFSEVLRREFASDYQIVVSTHDDRDMQYLKYMLSKQVNPREIQATDVQKAFYPANSELS